MTRGAPLRREFLRFLLSSPLVALAAGYGRPVWGGKAAPPDELAAQLIQTPEQALDLFDLEAVARRKIPIAHWGYLVCGSDDDRTAQLNVDAFLPLALRPRRFIDVTRIDTTLSLLGRSYASPIIVAPLSSQGAFHREAEVGVARAASQRKHLMVLSSLSTATLPAVAKAHPAPGHLWAQIYPTEQWSIAEALIRNAEAQGCEVLVLCADSPTRGNRISVFRHAKADTRVCVDCHDDPRAKMPTPQEFISKFAAYRGLDLSSVKSFMIPITWSYLEALRKRTKMKIVVKGVMTREDAALCVSHGVDALWVSNHGGRQENGGHPTIEVLSEVAEEVKGRIPVIFDGGVRRGVDAFKALALGATAVAIGRPQAWGLGAFGAPGVARVLELLQRELEITMRLCGTTRLAEITRAHVRWRPGADPARRG